MGAGASTETPSVPDLPGTEAITVVQTGYKTASTLQKQGVSHEQAVERGVQAGATKVGAQVSGAFIGGLVGGPVGAMVGQYAAGKMAEQQINKDNIKVARAANVAYNTKDLDHEPSRIPASELVGRTVRLRSSEFGGDKYLMISEKQIENGWKHKAFVAPLNAVQGKFSGEQKAQFVIENVPGAEYEIRLRVLGIFNDDKCLFISQDGPDAGRKRMFFGPPTHKKLQDGSKKTCFVMHRGEEEGTVRLRASKIFGNNRFVFPSDKDTWDGNKHSVYCSTLDLPHAKLPMYQKSVFVLEYV